jgi:hypothetical protein
MHEDPGVFVTLQALGVNPVRAFPRQSFVAAFASARFMPCPHLPKAGAL